MRSTGKEALLSAFKGNFDRYLRQIAAVAYYLHLPIKETSVIQIGLLNVGFLSVAFGDGFDDSGNDCHDDKNKNRDN